MDASGDVTMSEVGPRKLTILTMPLEVIEHILKHLPTRQDVLRVAFVSKGFCEVALPLVYRNVDWIVGSENLSACDATLRACAFLHKNPGLFTATRDLRVTETEGWYGCDLRLPLAYSNHEAPSSPLRRPSKNPAFAHTFRVSQQTLAELPNFRCLQFLTLRSVTLPRDFYQSLHAISEAGPGLKILNLRSVRLTTRYPCGYDPATLRITKLVIIQMLYNTSLPKLKAILKLARSQTLRTLRLDRSVETALGSLAAYGLPQTVYGLELDFRGNPPRGKRLLECLFGFLNKCKYVRHLELTDMGKVENLSEYPARMRLANTALPSLRSIKAPTIYFGHLSFGRKIDSLTVVDVIANHPPVIKFMKLNDVVELLDLVRSCHIKLLSLKFNYKEWDTELFYLLSATLNKAKVLHICYQTGDPEDGFYMSLGNVIEFPELERLYLYRPTHKMASLDADAFVDHNEYLIIWQRYMPNLREVALCSDVIWSRSEPKVVGGRTKYTWSRRVVKPMDVIEGLVTLQDAKPYRRNQTQGHDYARHDLFNEQLEGNALHDLLHNANLAIAPHFAFIPH